jgi:ribosomal protein S18 acetylase RimI-like enzyme
MVLVRRHLLPGDLGDIVALHGRLYSREHGHDETFEAMVAASVVDAAANGFPGAREGIWIVEQDRNLVGCLGLTDEGAGEARVRWFVLEPALRGEGLGRALLDELLAKVEHAGYTRVTLETFSDLEAAAHLYRERGFELVWEDKRPRWGRPEVTYQGYELDLTRPTRGVRGSAADLGSAAAEGALDAVEEPPVAAQRALGDL